MHEQMDTKLEFVEIPSKSHICLVFIQVSTHLGHPEPLFMVCTTDNVLSWRIADISAIAIESLTSYSESKFYVDDCSL